MRNLEPPPETPAYRASGSPQDQGRPPPDRIGRGPRPARVLDRRPGAADLEQVTTNAKTTPTTMAWITSPWTRAVIITTMLAGQAAVIGLAWVMVVRHEVFGPSAAEQAQPDELTPLAQAAARAVESAAPPDLERGSAGWSLAQQVLETVRLPDSARIEIVANDGTLLCSPGMPPLPGFDPDGAPASYQPTSRTSTVSVDLAGLDAALVVTQRLQGDEGLRPAQAKKLTAGTVAGGAGVMLVTGIGCAGLISVHGRRLQRQNAELTRRLTEQNREVVRTRNAMIYGLAKLADYRDSDTGDHLDRICQYAALLAGELAKHRDEIDPLFIETIRLAASMHDIGKVGIPDRVLLKPGRLDPDEMAVVRTHPRIGADTLLGIRERFGYEDSMLCMSIDIALGHHERWDGGGYPDGVAGESIPLSARIVAVADVYDALTSVRVYKPAMPHEQATRLIREGSGTQFDPAVVAAFVRVEHAFDRVRRASGAAEPLRTAAA